MSEKDELEEIMYWLGREIVEARQALWGGESGKAFASIEAAEEQFEKLEEHLEGTVPNSKLKSRLEDWREAADYAEERGYWKESDGINGCVDEIEALMEEE